MKKVIVLIGILSGLLCIPLNAYAYVLLDFEMPRESVGDHDHTIPTPYGDIDFNGRIWHKIQDVRLRDHTLDKYKGSFLKNTNEEATLTMTFDFDVQTINAWTVVYEDEIVYGEVYDVNDVLLDSGTIFPDSSDWTAWRNDELDIGGYSRPIRKLVLTGSDGNVFGIDDMTIYPVPEPMSLSLLGLGLLGAMGAGFKKKK